MTAKALVERNIELGFDFTEFLLEHPKLLDAIPDEARVVLLPVDDPQACDQNLQLAEQAAANDERPNRPTIYVLLIPTERKDKPVFIILEATPETQEHLTAIIRSLVTTPKRIVAVIS
jgi:hypothetical protein